MKKLGGKVFVSPKELKLIEKLPFNGITPEASTLLVEVEITLYVLVGVPEKFNVELVK